MTILVILRNIIESKYAQHYHLSKKSQQEGEIFTAKVQQNIIVGCSREADDESESISGFIQTSMSKIQGLFKDF